MEFLFKLYADLIYVALNELLNSELAFHPDNYVNV